MLIIDPLQWPCRPIDIASIDIALNVRLYGMIVQFH